jgi:hypothetical protein
LFVAPAVIVHILYGVPMSLLALLVCAAMNLAWSQWLKGRLSKDDIEAYEAVYDDSNQTEVFRLSNLNPPWTMWAVWIAAVIYLIW